MLSCPECRIPLLDKTRKCPVCGRNLFIRRWMIVVAVLLSIAGLLGGIAASGTIKNHLNWRATTATDAYRAAHEYLSARPEFRGALRLSDLKESRMERWDDRQWRVSGYADLRDSSGGPVRIRYLCVVRYESTNRWAVDDLLLETGR